MSSAPVPARAADAETPERFLLRVGPKALRYAMLCGSAARPPQRLVDAASLAFRRRAASRPAEHWPLLFWSGMVASAAESTVAPAGDPLERALAALPLAERQAFLLRVWLGLPAHDVARLLELPFEQYQQRLHSAVQQMRRAVAGERDDYDWVRHCRERLDRGGRPPRGSVSPRPPLRRLLGLALLGFGAVGLFVALPTPDDEAGPVPASAPARPSPVSADPIEQLLSLPPQDAELLRSEVDFELLAELEFVLWLDEQADAR